MSDVKIRNIPADEQYLLAIKTNIYTKGLLIPSFQRIKFIMTDKAMYYKIAGVLIDTTGTLYMRYEDIINVTMGKYLYNKKLIFSDKFGNRMAIVDKLDVINSIITILKNHNVNITE